MIIAGTGHRPSKLGNEYDHDGPISQYIIDETAKVLLENKPEKVISGMALGFDMLLAIAALSVQIPLLAAIPFRGQESAWPKKTQHSYNQILNHKLVTTFIVCKGGYAPWKMQRRNIWMCDNCDKLLACYNGDKSGGTFNCLEYAARKNIPIEYLDIDFAQINTDGK